MPVSKPPPVAEWPWLPVLVHVTVSPALTVMLPGLKLKSTIDTEPGPAATATGAEGSGGVSVGGDAASGPCAGGVAGAGAAGVVLGREVSTPAGPDCPSSPELGELGT